MCTERQMAGTILHRSVDCLFVLCSNGVGSPWCGGRHLSAHESITAFYNSTDADDLQRRLHRVGVNAKDFDSQYQAGLAALQKYGVLQ
jgi:hypothetical protein